MKVTVHCVKFLGTTEASLSVSSQVDSPLYMTLLSLFVYSLEQWNEVKIAFLKRLIVTAHARHLSPTGISKYGLHVLYLYRFIYALDVKAFVVIFKRKHTSQIKGSNNAEKTTTWKHRLVTS